MRKQPKKPRVPRTRGGFTMTEAQFWGFIRSNLRLMSRKWRPHNVRWRPRADQTRATIND